MAVPANVDGVEDINEFPDSGTNMTIISSQLVRHMTSLPWSRPPLVGGGSVTPCGTVCLRIFVGDIPGAVEAAVLENNTLPLILGEDWFCASRTQLLVKPPHSSQLRHPGRNSVVNCSESILPRMGNAVILLNSNFWKWHRAPTTSAGLQLEFLPEDQKHVWTLMSSSTCSIGAALPVTTTVYTPATPISSLVKDSYHRETTPSSHLRFEYQLSTAVPTAPTTLRATIKAVALAMPKALIVPKAPALPEVAHHDFSASFANPVRRNRA